MSVIRPRTRWLFRTARTIPPEGAGPMSTDAVRTPVVFIHGLWIHGESWRPWIELFRRNGYDAVAAKWPGEAETPEATRKNSAVMAGYGLHEVADYITGQLNLFHEKPV